MDVAADAPIGARDLFVAGARRAARVAVYDKIDYHQGDARLEHGPRRRRRVSRRCSRSSRRLAWSHGPDGKPDTKDDLNLGAGGCRRGRVEEYTATFDDDDVKFVGEIDRDARLVHAGAWTARIPKRSGNRNNIGDVWVVADAQARGRGAPMRARAHLVVTVPLYMRWDFFTIGDQR